MAFSSSTNVVDPRPRVRKLSGTSSGLTVSGNTYSANDRVGQVFTFSGASRSSSSFGTITTAILHDKAGVVGATDLYLFTQPISSSPDNSAINFSSVDMQYFVGTVSFPGPINIGSGGRVSTVPAVGLTYSTDSTVLYGYLVTLTNNNFFTTSADIDITLMAYHY